MLCLLRHHRSQAPVARQIWLPLAVWRADRSRSDHRAPVPRHTSQAWRAPIPCVRVAGPSERIFPNFGARSMSLVPFQYLIACKLELEIHCFLTDAWHNESDRSALLLRIAGRKGSRRSQSHESPGTVRGFYVAEVFPSPCIFLLTKYTYRYTVGSSNGGHYGQLAGYTETRQRTQSE